MPSVETCRVISSSLDATRDSLVSVNQAQIQTAWDDPTPDDFKICAKSFAQRLELYIDAVEVTFHIRKEEWKSNEQMMKLSLQSASV